MCELEKLRVEISERETRAICDVTVYLRAHGEGYVCDFLRQLPSCREVTMARLRAMLGEGVASGEFGTEIRRPPHRDDPRARAHRRYYWLKKK
jgi:hypothetical protein